MYRYLVRVGVTECETTDLATAGANAYALAAESPTPVQVVMIRPDGSIGDVSWLAWHGDHVCNWSPALN